jgi:DNA-binding beta-propeller fold protein YncE
MAGNRVSVLAPDGARRVLVEGLDGPHHLLLGPGGALYVADTWNHRVVRVDVGTGRLTPVAGTGEKGFSGDGGAATEARFGGRGEVLITDTENHAVRVYSPADGTLRRLAGTGERGAAGLGGPALSLQLNRPHGAVVHPGTGALYISDSDNHRVVRIDP